MTSRSRRRIAAAAAVAASLAGLGLASSTFAEPKPDSSRLSATPIRIVATPIRKFDKAGTGPETSGKLRFLGGLVLTSPGNKNFGGWSGIALDRDTKSFVAVSDAGVWMTGQITYADGAPQGIEAARIGPLLGLDGKPLARPRDRDAEAIALERGSPGDGEVLIAFERNSRLARYRVGPEGVSRAIELLGKPAEARKMRGNQGFEALTVLKGGPFKGRPIAMAERYYDSARNHTGWIWTDRGPKSLHLRNIGDFDITDVASLDDGTVFILERRFRWLEGVKMRVRRIEADALRPGAVIEGEVLIEAGLEDEIDNMEGLDVTRRPSGDILITMISDDNYNPLLQRNLLLQFALSKSGAEKTRPEG